MATKITITYVHNLEHIHKGTGSESLDRFLSNEEQYTYSIFIDDTNTGKAIAFSIKSVCPLDDDKKCGTSIYRTKQEAEKAVQEEFDIWAGKYGSISDAEITEEEREFGKEAA